MFDCFSKKQDLPLYVSLLEKRVRALQSQVVALQIQVSSKQARIETLETKLNEHRRKDET